MKRILIFMLVSLMLLVAFTSCSSNQTSSETSSEKSSETPEVATHVATIKIKDYGTVVVELYRDKAPITVDNFVKLCEEGFYDGTTFHRIISGFMAQGGGFNEDGTQKRAATIKGEFKANGVENDISHVRGVISMARANAYDSASSQFFIMHKNYKSLDGQYAAFGRVITGMDVIDKICSDARPTDNNGSIAISDRPVIESITVEKVENQ